MRQVLILVATILCTIHGISSTKMTLTLDSEFTADSTAARDLMASSRSLENSNMNGDMLSQYSIKYQSCHEVSQWSDKNSGSTKIQIERLIQFRICPISTCSNNKSTGCASKYGDFIVDINTFVYYYLLVKQQQDAYDCDYYSTLCQSQCNDDDSDNCEKKCYQSYGLYDICGVQSDDGDDYVDGGSGSGIDALDYAQCAAYDGFGDGAYYIGPYCVEETSNINFALFSDDECTKFSSCNGDCFYEKMGFTLPYSDASIVSTDCVSCSDGADEDPYYYTPPLDECIYLYLESGKCETKMNVESANDSACSFIKGMKFIRGDGVISSTVRRSKFAAVIIGLSSVSAVVLGFYVHVLHTKLSRARFNLSSGAINAVL